MDRSLRFDQWLAAFSLAIFVGLSLPGAVSADDDPAAPDEKIEQPAKPAAEAPAKSDPEADKEYYELYQVFADTLDQVERNYVKKVSRRELMEAAIHGVLNKLDPYSNYISPEELGRFRTSVESQFGGIGIQISMEREQLKILSPLVGTPAYRAGLQAGDSIVEIEGKSTEGISLDDAVRKLKGEAGTSVTITVIHPGTIKRETVTVAREVIHVETVLGDHRRDDDSWEYQIEPDKHIGYIRVTAFSRDTAADLKKALDDLKGHNFRGLILDLRFNPGGLLTSAIEVSDMFVSKGRIVSTQGRNTPERAWDAVEAGTYEGFPIAILVNRYSASASEIVSACLQDHKRAVVIGERTWGKGSVQNVIELENGKSALKLTTAGYKRPNGHNIHRFPDAKESDEWGVMPDKGYELRLSDSEMGELVRDRRQRDILVFHQKSPAKPEEKKPEEKKPDDAKPEDKKPDEKKPNEKKPDEKKDDAKKDDDKKSAEKPAEDKKPDAAKPDEKKPDEKPADDKKADEKKADEKKPDDAKPEDKKPDEKPADPKPAKFLDRQLQKAIDYLTTELAAAK